MTLPNPQHLLEHADLLAAAPPRGAPRQTNLRRALSSAYYAQFHFTLRSVSDVFVGVNQRSAPAYQLAYRSVDHGWARTVCDRVGSERPQVLSLFPRSTLDPNVRDFATTLLECQEQRHKADYDPAERFDQLGVRLTIDAVRIAIRRFGAAPEEQRRAFLALLLFRKR